MVGFMVSDVEIFAFEIDGKLVGIEIDKIDAVTKSYIMSDAPKKSDIIEHMISYRDDIITLLNLDKYLYNNKDSDSDLVVICNIHDNNKLAFRICDSGRIIKIKRKHLHELDAMIKDSCYMVKWYAGLIKDYHENDNEKKTLMDNMNVKEKKILIVLDMDIIYDTLNSERQDIDNEIDNKE